MIDECFDLAPPAWVKRAWLSNPQGTDLFTTFRKKSGLFPGQPQTVQGFYCMTAGGDHLADKFARIDNAQARRAIASAWKKFQALADENGWRPKPIPNDKIELVIGKKTQPGGLKIQIASRDLPRGDNRRPGTEDWEREAYNLNWLDLSPTEAAHFTTTASKRQLPQDVVEKFAKQTIKDNVRGQNGWHDNVSQESKLQAEHISTRDNIVTTLISGFAVLSEDNRKIAVHMNGKTEFDKMSGEFIRFDLFASGQRSGFTPANGRRHDQGPAPLGFAFRKYKKQ